VVDIFFSTIDIYSTANLMTYQPIFCNMIVKEKSGGLSLAQREDVINKTKNSIHLKTWPKITTFQQGQCARSIFLFIKLDVLT
jgi:hypothetical protein